MVGAVSAINDKFINLLLEIARATRNEAIPTFQLKVGHKKANSRIQELVADALTKGSERELNEEQLNLLRFCRKLVAVEYHNYYGLSVYEANDNKYNVQTDE